MTKKILDMKGFGREMLTKNGYLVNISRGKLFVPNISFMYRHDIKTTWGQI